MPLQEEPMQRVCCSAIDEVQRPVKAAKFSDIIFNEKERAFETAIHLFIELLALCLEGIKCLNKLTF